MSETTEPTKWDDIVTQLQQLAVELKDEIAVLIDQKLDELGAAIGGDNVS